MKTPITIQEANYNLYKSQSERYEKLIPKLTKLIPTEDMLRELKKRKIIKFDWTKNQWEQYGN